MKALLRKDLYMIRGTMVLWFLFILFFGSIPKVSNNVFAVVYSAMLPYTCMAYDEKCKWDRLAAMMPYSVRDIVLSKYLLGWMYLLGAAVLTAALRSVILVVFQTGGVYPAILLLTVCGAVCIMDITLPIMFRFGVEKGRLLMLLMIFLVCGSAGAMGIIAEDLVAAPNSFYIGTVLPGMVLAAAALTAISVPLSVKLYRRRMRA